MPAMPCGGRRAGRPGLAATAPPGTVWHRPALCRPVSRSSVALGVKPSEKNRSARPMAGTAGTAGTMASSAGPCLRRMRHFLIRSPPRPPHWVHCIDRRGGHTRRSRPAARGPGSSYTPPADFSSILLLFFSWSRVRPPRRAADGRRWPRRGRDVLIDAGSTAAAAQPRPATPRVAALHRTQNNAGGTNRLFTKTQPGRSGRGRGGAGEQQSCGHTARRTARHD